jgi:large subunit ribosomal protein L29
MLATELRALSVEDLNKELHDLLREQFNLNLQKSTSEVARSHRIKRVRRDIARVKTILHEKVGE